MTQSRVEDVWPLSPLQEGLLFHALYDGQGPDVYVGQHVLEVSGPLDAGLVRASGQALVDRHAALRAGFRQPAGSGQPVQVVARRVALPWREADVSHLAGKQAVAEAERLAGEELGGGLIWRRHRCCGSC